MIPEQVVLTKHLNIFGMVISIMVRKRGSNQQCYTRGHAPISLRLKFICAVVRQLSDQ